jgi:hypothetical protein
MTPYLLVIFIGFLEKVAVPIVTAVDFSEDARLQASPKRKVSFNNHDGIIPHKITLFINDAVKSSYSSLRFKSEGVEIFLRNVGTYVPNCTASYSM